MVSPSSCARKFLGLLLGMGFDPWPETPNLCPPIKVWGCPRLSTGGGTSVGTRTLRVPGHRPHSTFPHHPHAHLPTQNSTNAHDHERQPPQAAKDRCNLQHIVDPLPPDHQKQNATNVWWETKCDQKEMSSFRIVLE